MDASQNTPISVQGWSPRYIAAFEKLIGVEGGLADDPVDRGGTTKYGISLRFLKIAGALDLDHDGYRDFDLDFDGDIDGADIRLLTIGDAKYLYFTHFWKDMDCENFPVPIGELLFDQAVNGGSDAARKLLQRAISACLGRTGHSLIAVDGQIGPATRAAMDKVVACPRLGMNALVEEFREAVRDRYRAIVRHNPSQKRFLKGWLRRADELGV